MAVTGALQPQVAEVATEVQTAPIGGAVKIMRGRQHAYDTWLATLVKPGRNPLAAGLDRPGTSSVQLRPAPTGVPDAAAGRRPLCQLSDKIAMATRSRSHFTAIHPPAGVCRQRTTQL